MKNNRTKQIIPAIHHITVITHSAKRFNVTTKAAERAEFFKLTADLPG